MKFKREILIERMKKIRLKIRLIAEHIMNL